MRQLLVAWALVTATEIAAACSCARIATIDETIAGRSIVVEARVVALERSESKEFGSLVLNVTLLVTKVLKGAVSTKTIVVENRMCYVSLYPALMKVGHTYVLPLSAPAAGRYQLAGCAHSGLELVAGSLYSFEQSNGAERRLELYMQYDKFLRKLAP